jgi:hypothetical protein
MGESKIAAGNSQTPWMWAGQARVLAHPAGQFDVAALHASKPPKRIRSCAEKDAVAAATTTATPYAATTVTM